MSSTVPLLDPATWSELACEIRRRQVATSPEWTDHAASEPEGAGLVEGIAILAFTVGYWATLRKVFGLGGLRQYAATVASPDVRWLPVDSLDEAGPADRVYELDPSTGVVRFGDGVHGERPPSGLTVSIQSRSTSRGVLVEVLGALGWGWLVAWFWARKCDRGRI